jgi:uncharacterized membrane protein
VEGGAVVGGVMAVVAWVVVVLAAGCVIGGPFVIGQERKPYSAGSYLAGLVQAGLMTALAGRVLGWW